MTHLIMKFAVLLAMSFASGCIIVTVGDDGDEHELLFGPDEHCPRECINPADETCYHLPGGCGRGDGVDDEDEEDGCGECG